MPDDIAEKYNSPHHKTNALLAGLVCCPFCCKQPRVFPNLTDGQTASRDLNMSVPATVKMNVLSRRFTAHCLMDL